MEKGGTLLALNEKTERQGGVSMAELMASSSNATDLSTIELQVVKESGGNWAEFQWVLQALLNARSQKDGDDAIRHNHALYRKYEGQLSDIIDR